jgi:hypothetical protein
MNIHDAFAQAFGQPNIQKITTSSRRITDGATVTTNIGGMSTLGMNVSTHSGTGSLGSSQFGQTFSQPSFGSNSGSFTNKPVIPFQLLDGLEKAILIKQFLIERGVERINEETAKALFLVSCVLKDQVLPPVKQAKKKLII